MRFLPEAAPTYPSGSASGGLPLLSEGSVPERVSAYILHRFAEDG